MRSTANLLTIAILKNPRFFFEKPSYFFEKKTKFWTFRENLLFQSHSTANSVPFGEKKFHAQNELTSF